MTKVWHLYEVVISNSLVWLKLQASRSSSEILSRSFETHFTGTDYSVEGHRPVTPFKLSQRSRYIAIGRQLWISSQRVGTTTNSTLWGLPIHGAKPCRTTAIATDRRVGWPYIVLILACTMRPISGQASPRTSSTISISNRWRRGLLASMNPEGRRGSKERGNHRPGVSSFSRRSLKSKPESRGG